MQSDINCSHNFDLIRYVLETKVIDYIFRCKKCSLCYSYYKLESSDFYSDVIGSLKTISITWYKYGSY